MGSAGIGNAAHCGWGFSARGSGRVGFKGKNWPGAPQNSPPPPPPPPPRTPQMSSVAVVCDVGPGKTARFLAPMRAELHHDGDGVRLLHSPPPEGPYLRLCKRIETEGTHTAAGDAREVVCDPPAVTTNLTDRCAAAAVVAQLAGGSDSGVAVHAVVPLCSADVAAGEPGWGWAVGQGGQLAGGLFQRIARARGSVQMAHWWRLPWAGSRRC
jgi:hypothetical protein